MAISPPSDIVLDVARAVEPADLQTARTELARRTGAATPTGIDAAFSLASSAVQARGATRQADPTDQATAYRKFEGIVLQTFIQSMLPKDAEQVYGKGVAGDMWKSMMAGRIADVMTERGGIGIADHLLADHYRDGDVKAPIGQISRGLQNSDLDRQDMLSSALLQELQRKAAQMIDGVGSPSTSHES